MKASQVEILPFHQMGREKWHKLGIQYQLENVEPPSAELMERVRGQFRSRGLRSTDDELATRRTWLVIIFGDTMWLIQLFVYSSRHLSRDVTIKASAGCAKVTRRGHTNGEEINESPNESIFICGKYLLTRS